MPCVAVSVYVRVGVPLIVGAAMLAAGYGEISSVGGLAAVTMPSRFEALTSMRTTSPSSAVPSTYCALVAPAMFVQFVPSADRCH